MSQAQVLITGGAGYIGSRLAQRLAGCCEVTVLDNLRRGTRDALGAVRGGVRFVEGDIRDPETVERLTRGVEVIFHLAAESAVLAADAAPEYCFETNVTGTFRVLQAARANGVRRVVFSSSREVYGDPECIPVAETAPLGPKNAYGCSKAAAEMLCGAFGSGGIEVAIARFSNVYGPGDRGRVIPRFVENALSGLPFRLFGGGQVMDFVWIETAVAALVRLGFGPYLAGPFNIASGKGVSIDELSRRVKEAAGSSSRVEIDARREIEVLRFVADVGAAQAALGLPVPEDPLFGLEEVVVAARAQRELQEIHL